MKSTHDIVNADTGEVVIEAGKKLSARQARKLAEEGLKDILLPDDALYGRYLAEDIVNMDTGEILRRGWRRSRQGDARQFCASTASSEFAAARHRPCDDRRLHPQHAA